mmetsp:Transcript_6608/g.24533  ORF Transcript_6608/g.24533 Transcript_6608/m.24533 type:complete len:570 (+) Transcript_6608:152-1861(+)
MGPREGTGHTPASPKARRSKRRRDADTEDKSYSEAAAQVQVQAAAVQERRRRPGLKMITPSEPASSPAYVAPKLPVFEATEDGIDESRFSKMDAVVKVFCMHTEPNYSLPWQRKRQYSSYSSGFIIAGRRIITNAHSVEHFTQVKVRRCGQDVKYVAKVLAIGTECDIALLTVEEKEFWSGVEAVAFGPLPRLQDTVTVVGYPIGGDTISVTQGVVSRLEVTSYAHVSAELLGVQIDAAINSGNSGGPAFNGEGQCVGIAFQSMAGQDADGIGYVIPTPVIQHFIHDFEAHAAYTGFPSLGVEWQSMENKSLRMAYGMKPSQKGVLIRRVEPTAPSAAQLKPGMVILSFDGINIASDGTVPFRHGERISFSYLVSRKYTRDTVTVDVLYEGKRQTLEVVLGGFNLLIPVHLKGASPSYYIVAGLVFTPVTVPYLRSEYGKEYEYESPVKLLEKMLHAQAKAKDEQIIVISQVLAADVNIGYEDTHNTQVLAFNGKPITNLKQLALLVENSKEEFFKFELEHNQVVVLSGKEARAATGEVLKVHGIPASMSKDIREYLQSGKTGKAKSSK